MAKEKKDDVIRARVEESLAKNFAKYCTLKGWSEAQVLREAVKEFMANNPIKR